MPEPILRNERPEDRRAVEELTREAFWNEHAPGCDEHYLVHIMRDADAFITPLSTVAEMDGRIVGHIAYTKARIACDDGTERDVVSFGPVSVLPVYQGMGVGRALIESTLNRARSLGYEAVLIYGDPLYYARFGFDAAEKYGVATAGNMYAPALLALELTEGALSGAGGRFLEDGIFDIDKKAARAFDQTFAPKELRGGLASQKRFAYLVGLQRPRHK